MVWGFTNPREGGKPLVNCRVETAGFKPFWRESWQRRRCIIPCSYYFEWEHYTTIKGEKKAGQKYMIQPTGALITYLAGLYDIEEGFDEDEEYSKYKDKFNTVLPYQWGVWVT